MAPELGEEWIDVLLDDKEPLPADLMLAIRAALRGPARGEVAFAAKGFRDAVGITIPKRMKTDDINKYFDLAFGNTFEPLPAAAEGKVRLRCTRKTADTVRKGVVVRGEEIRAQTTKKRDANGIGDGEPSDDNDNGHKRREAGESAGRGAKKGSGRKLFVGCYGCGKDHGWTACHPVGPFGQK